MEAHTSPCVKETARGDLLRDAGSSTQRSETPSVVGGRSQREGHVYTCG